ncbi:hypothetical protein E2C01_044515 [Portunus trituberculatus]|uniref:Uncharacterized protein n=1 Tax=Portunus trituberculatus TaxID=210409 RepID=A0A5B7FYM6_PORTR|nr:hypothetical protein [Portunus trituberculatus]
MQTKKSKRRKKRGFQPVQYHDEFSYSLVQLFARCCLSGAAAPLLSLTMHSSRSAGGSTVPSQRCASVMRGTLSRAFEKIMYSRAMDN